MAPVNSEAIAKAVTDILVAVGEDPSREGLVNTPQRVAELFAELYSGVGVDPLEVLTQARKVASKPDERGDLVALRDIAFHALCEHHLLPFDGVASVVYQPSEAIVGLGTLTTLVKVVASRPQLQERVGEMVVSALVDSGVASGALVMISATHGCVRYRGPQQELTAVTVAARGTLALGQARHEALMMVGGAQQE
ncbi:MAG: GTP cyclohydrolase I FolE [Microbacteriaceae bacterium]|jgi:GTP cyclohydrolase IA|tara:strand:- start:413 stop:997 length:585 start_codon:yes stop_codon:yes gene_type:complete